jgi:hypothetical protein
MTKQLKAHANGTSAANNGAVISVTGTVIEGTKDSLMRYITMEVDPWVVSSLLGHMLTHYPADLAAAIRKVHPEQSWQVTDELGVLMRAIASLIEA